MGGWLMLLAALKRPERLCGLLGLAAAPDFTERLQDSLSQEQLQQLASSGFTDLPNCYDEGLPYRIGQSLLDEGADHLLLEREIAIDLPVRLIHGQRDDDVPWRIALQLADRLRCSDVEVQLVKHGDHRLSEPMDVQRLLTTTESLLDQA